ncbi:MAG: NAD-dependent epimerase/dehydratase family protein [Cytophaga sp.]|uniref:NAD-dependent epimerase/dehydratase family protein n=1 Tax=Cytophaga sp. TaxID=29535 RepID=UPI003F7F6D9D
MPKILITGSAGFIGFHLAEILCKQNYEVVGIDTLNNYYDVNLKIDRLHELKKYKNFKFYSLSICDKDDIDELFKEHAFEYVVNLAAQAGVRYSIDKPYKYIDSNLIGFINVLEACRKFRVKHFIFASSSSIYGNSEIPFSEDQQTDTPLSLYAATKKANELMAHSYAHLYQIPITGLRFFTVYGPWGRPDMAYFSFAKKIIDGQPIKIFNEGHLMRDFTYIDDIVEAITKLIPQPVVNANHFEVFNIGNNNPVKLLDFIELLENIIGQKAIKEFLPMQDGDVLSTYANIDKLFNKINFKPSTPLNTGLTRFVEWYKNYYNC